MSELDKLEEFLKSNNIKYERIDVHHENEVLHSCGIMLIMDRHQICVPDQEHAEWDAVCQHGSYGFEEGLLEIYGNIVRADADDTVEGWLTADDVIDRIKEANT